MRQLLPHNNGLDNKYKKPSLRKNIPKLAYTELQPPQRFELYVMRKLAFCAVLALLPQIALAGEFFVFNTVQKIPQGCIHYASPNRYICRENFSQIEFHDVAYANTLFQPYRNSSDTNVVYKKKEEEFFHQYAEKPDENGLLRIYSLCKDEKCIVVVSYDEQAISQWLTPHSVNLLVTSNK